MKKMIYTMLAILAFVPVGCGKSPQTAPLEGNPQLVTITEKSEDGQNLISVVNPQTGQVIIPPTDYSEVIGDEYVVYAKRKNGVWTMVKTNGDYIGTFEMLTPWKTNGTYYLGVTYTFKTYYFPKEDFLITSQKVHTEHEVLFIENKGSWLVLNYDGKMLMALPSSFTVIKDAKIPTNMWIAVLEEGKNPSCTVYDISGEVHNKLSPTEWHKLKKTLTVQKKVTDTVSITATEYFNRF